MDDKVNLESLDIKKNKIRQLKEVFPEVVSEDKVDFEKLRLTLGDEIEIGKERYGMNWPGKANCFKIIQTPSKATLKPSREESVDFDTTENLFIEGDSLEVLKLLQSSYYGKVKMIYIDPPYNTGNDFIYPDNYAESLETYLRYTGQKGKDGLKLSTNTESEGRYHSKWMNMMYARLFLAKNILKEDGMIFISIDDHEIDNLKKICNEIFGEENFMASFTWKTRQAGGKQLAQNNISVEHEYVILYKKNGDTKLRGQDRDRNAYSNPDNDSRGNWTKFPIDIGSTKDERPNCYYDLIDPETKNVYKANPNRVWAFSKPTMAKLIDEKRIIFNPTGKTRPFLKRFWAELESEQRPISTWASKYEEYNDDPYHLEVAFNTEGTKIVNELFDGLKIFDYPKPVSLIKELIIQGSDSNGIILDFMAGSGTTAQAVLELNKEKSNRQFILVQIPEPTDENSEAYRAGYKTIAEIGKERIRRVIKKLKEEKDGKLDLDEKQDLGFRVFKLDESNFKVWDGEKPEDLAKQLELYKNNVKDDSKPGDILYELILKSGFEISCKVEEMEIQGKKVYSIEDGQLMICLENGLTKELMKEIADKEPARVVCLDEGFEENDQLLTNCVEILKTKGIEFRTV